MSSQTPDTRPVPRARAGWRQWLQLALAAVAMLALSEALWMWQTWPVRELLQVAPASAPGPR